MTAINFPDSPSDGATHVVGGVTYTYNSAETKWKTTINSNAFLPLSGGTVSGNLVLGGELQHSGDTDTKLHFDTDTIKLDTAGSERFRVGSAGQLGIGGATYGTDGQVLTSTGATTAPAWEDLPAGGLFDAYALLRDVKATNTSGGTFTSGAWRTRDLNEETHDPSGIVTLSSNQFTLAAGTYYIIWRTPSFAANRTISRVYNVTDSSVEDYSDLTYSVTGTGYSQQSNEGRVRLTLTASKTFRIEHRSEQSGTFGLNSEYTADQIFTQVEIFREA